MPSCQGSLNEGCPGVDKRTVVRSGLVNSLSLAGSVDQRKTLIGTYVENPGTRIDEGSEL